MRIDSRMSESPSVIANAVRRGLRLPRVVSAALAAMTLALASAGALASSASAASTYSGQLGTFYGPVCKSVFVSVYPRGGFWYVSYPPAEVESKIRWGDSSPESPTKAKRTACSSNGATYQVAGAHVFPAGKAGYWDGQREWFFDRYYNPFTARWVADGEPFGCLYYLDRPNPTSNLGLERYGCVG
jgi:hypothetical protein